MSYRNLEINGQKWRYRVGANYLDIRNPEGQGFRPSKEIVGGYIATYPREKFPITPKQVRAWIERHAS